jgi:membrane-associated protein
LEIHGLARHSYRMFFIQQSTSIGQIFDPSVFLKSVGPWALLVVVVIVFIETGLLFPFLPGDSLVFAAAIVIGSLGVPLWVLMLIVAITAIAGSSTAFAIGRRTGPRLFKDDARIFKTRYRDEANTFFEKYGAGALVLARFVPIVRTYVAPIVGASTMSWRRFMLWNVVGGVLWSVILGIAGYFLGKISFVANNVEAIAILIIVVSVLPVAIGIVRTRLRERRAAPALRSNAE